AGDGQAVDRGDVVVKHHGVALAGDGGLDGRRVVGAADVDVGDADRRDRRGVVGLGTAAPVDHVAGVDHGVDVEGAHDGADQAPRGGVQVQVGDVQDAGGVAGRLIDRQGADRRIEPAHVADDLLQLVGVAAVVVGYPAGVTDHRGRVD